MGNMYKETVSRKKLPSIVKSFIILVCVLFLCEIVKTLPIEKKYISETITMLSFILVVFLLIIEIVKCRVKYTYSIIADQFIIHRIKGEDDKVVENIKIRDVEYIGVKNVSKRTNNVISSKRYICSILNFKPYCCIYREKDKFRRFYFEPSNNLIQKIKFHSKKTS